MDSLKIKKTGKPKKGRKNTDITLAIHQGISELYHEDMCTDFEIIVGDKTFHCHRVVLAAVSDYFRAMFTSGMKETIQNQATFEDLSPKVFEVILQMLYPDYDDGDDRVDPLDKASEEEMSELLRVAEMLQMKFLLEKCCCYFKSTMSPTNCIERWKMARSIMNEEVSKFAWEFLLNNFQMVASEKMLLTLEFEDIRDMIEHEGLVVDNEDTVWKVIYEWIKFDETTRKVYLKELLQGCCLTQLVEDTLFEEVIFDPMIRENDAIIQLVQEAILYIRHPALQASVEVKLRDNNDKERMLALICKKKSWKGSSLKKSLTPINTIFLSSKTQKVITVRPLVDVREELGFCVHGSSLYISCGQKLLKYTAEDDQWDEKENLLVPLRSHMMVASDSFLFAIGGLSAFSVSSQIIKYNIEGDSWDIAGEILVPITNASAVYIKNKIYIFGGKMGDGQLVDSVQEYDVRNNQSTILCHLPKPCEFSRAVNKGDGAYIVTSDGDVIHFSATTHKVDVIAHLENFRSIDFGIEMRDGEIHIYGGKRMAGEDSDDDVDKIAGLEEYAIETLSVDITTGETAISKKFPFPMQVLGCASVMMSSKEINKRPY